MHAAKPTFSKGTWSRGLILASGLLSMREAASSILAAPPLPSSPPPQKNKITLYPTALLRYSSFVHMIFICVRKELAAPSCEEEVVKLAMGWVTLIHLSITRVKVGKRMWFPQVRGSLNTPDERCTCQVRMPGSMGFIFLALPILTPWGLFLVFLAKFGFYGPKLL